MMYTSFTKEDFDKINRAIRHEEDIHRSASLKRDLGDALHKCQCAGCKWGNGPVEIKTVVNLLYERDKERAKTRNDLLIKKEAEERALRDFRARATAAMRKMGKVLNQNGLTLEVDPLRKKIILKSKGKEVLHTMDFHIDSLK